MKLFMSEITKTILDRLLLVEIDHICSGGENCPERKYEYIINTSIKKYVENRLVIRDLTFLIDIISGIYNDGRNCKSSYIKESLLKLTNNEWKKDNNIITAGIKNSTIILEHGDRILENI